MKNVSATLAALLLAAVAMSGCYRHNIITGGVSYPEPVYQDNFHHHLFWGLANIEKQDIAASNLCPTGVSHAQTRISVVNGIVTFLTGGIYSPSQVRIWCTDALDR